MWAEKRQMGYTISGKSAENERKVGKNFAQNRRSVLPGNAEKLL